MGIKNILAVVATVLILGLGAIAFILIAYSPMKFVEWLFDSWPWR